MSGLLARLQARIPLEEGSLVLITMIWGATFIIIRSALEATGPFFFVGVRFAFAALALILFSLPLLKDFTWREVWAGMSIGLCIFGGYALDVYKRQAQSRAARMEARAEFLPDATGTGELARSRNYAPDGTATKLDASVQLALAVDVFGGLRRSLEAAGADLEAAGISLADARASLAVEVANGYVDLRLAQEKLRIALENVAVQRDTVRIIQARADAGTVAMLDLHAARAQMETTQASVPSAEAEVVAAIRGLEAVSYTHLDVYKRQAYIVHGPPVFVPVSMTPCGWTRRTSSISMPTVARGAVPA